MKNIYGETTIDAKPERVATLSWVNADTALALGTVPVAMPKIVWGNNANNSNDWTDAKLKELGAEKGSDEAPTFYDEPSGDVNYDAIADSDPDVILAGRRTNDGMGAYVANEVIRLMVRKGINPVGARILILGLAFKENCPDLRNTRVVDVVSELRAYNAEVDVYDPWVDADEAGREYGIDALAKVERNTYDAIVLAVGHRQFADMGAAGIRAFGKPGAVLYDVKYVLPKDSIDARL